MCFNEWKLDATHINLHGQAEVEAFLPRHELHPDDYYLEVLLSDGGSGASKAFSRHVPFRVPGRTVENQGMYRPRHKANTFNMRDSSKNGISSIAVFIQCNIY